MLLLAVVNIAAPYIFHPSTCGGNAYHCRDGALVCSRLPYHSSCSPSALLSAVVDPRSLDILDAEVDDSDNTLSSSSELPRIKEKKTSPPPKNKNKPKQPELIHGSYLYRPEGHPRALIHFIGGALAGASPQLFYRLMLETLADRGFLVVATPFDLSFDQLLACDSIVEKFELIAPDLLEEFGPLSVVGVGHSFGALAQLLISMAFPTTPRTANVFISYNNKKLMDAIPLYDQLFSPLFTAFKNLNVNRLLDLSLRATEELSNGEVISDELLVELRDIVLNRTSDNGGGGREKGKNMDKEVILPGELRKKLEEIVPTELARDLGLLNFLKEGVDFWSQLPPLFDSVANGSRTFEPSPEAVIRAIPENYDVRRSLILQFDNDATDESEKLESNLIDIARQDIKRCVIPGNHFTPVVGLASDSSVGKGNKVVDEVIRLVDELDEWLK